MRAVDLPWLSATQMRAADELAVRRYGIDLPLMMELAGRHLAALALARFLAREPAGRRVVVLAGSGGNGGGALVAARRLHNLGARVEVWLTHPPDAMSPVAASQVERLERVGVRADWRGAPAADTEVAVVLDGVVGYGLGGAPRGRAAELIDACTRLGAPALALDVPSGLDCERGVLMAPRVCAAATLALAVPKRGLQGCTAAGDLYLGDLGWPPELFAQPPLGVAYGSPFAAGDLVRLVPA